MREAISKILFVLVRAEIEVAASSRLVLLDIAIYHIQVNKRYTKMSPSRGRPLEFPVKKLIRMDQETADAIEKAAAKITDDGSQSETIRRILRDWLASKGYLKN